ncbi:MAG TPA: ATP-binding protein [Pedococcus sp.]
MTTRRQQVLQAPARRQVRGIIAVLLCLTLGVVAAGVAAAGYEARVVRGLTLAFGPGAQANSEVLLVMGEAESAWRESSIGVGPPGAAQRYAASKAEVERLLDDVGTSLARDEVSEAKQRQYRRLLEAERSAAAAWFAAADALVARQATSPSTPPPSTPPPPPPGAPGGPPPGPTGERPAPDPLVEKAITAFDDFRATNRALDAVVQQERNEARALSRNALWIFVAVLLTGAVVIAGTLVAGGRLVTASLIAPLERLRQVLARQREGDDRVSADERTGSAEVRALAADYNELNRDRRHLQEEQAQTLMIHRLTLEVARRVRATQDIDEALDMVCASLGEGLAVDRVLLHTVDEDGRPDRSAQFHRYDLPPLPPLPPSLMGQVADVNDELRREATVFRLRDLLDPDVADEPRVAAYHRATGARSLLMVPIGVGEGGLGLLALMTVDLPRRWRRYEIQGVQQCVGYVAQAIVSARLGEMQAEQLERLTALDRQKTDFMATVSHELRTPLTSISGYLELLEDGDYGDLDPAQLSALGVIRRNTLRLRGLIEDLLVLNKIETSGLHSQPEDTAVGDIVAAVVEVLGPAAAGDGVELVAEPPADDLCVHVDRSQLERALINLGSNAVKFTPAGGQVRLAAERSGDRVAISVTDTGIGIPHDDLERLGSRFFRASNATAKAIPGTGLGLAIVRTIVEGHGGQMFVASAEGEGTTVRLFLPSAGVAVAPSPS